MLIARCYSFSEKELGIVVEDNAASGTQAALSYKAKRRDHWDRIARKMDSWSSQGGYYHERLAQVYRYLVPPGLRVLEIGCGKGDLLAALEPSHGVGIDFSDEMLQRAREKYSHLSFINNDVHKLNLDETFDVIIFSDVVNDLWDVQAVLEQTKKLAGPETRIIVNSFSRVWELPLIMAQKLGLSTPLLPQNWLTAGDIANMLSLTGYEVIRYWLEIMWPFDTPFISTFLNKYITKIWPFSFLGLTNFIIARPAQCKDASAGPPMVSVVVPTRNEEGNIEEIFRRTPEMGGGTELIFVEGNSKDNTYEAIEKAIARHPERNAKLYRQTGKGKGDAVRLGFLKATGDILMILDADMTVPPEDLPRFYEAIASGHGDFINGVRLVYPMEKQAMRYFNIIGNKFFSLAFTWLFGQSIKDTLCGTKVLSRKNYEALARNRKYFGDFDPFGDFDLLLGAAKMNLKIVEMPIRYAERKYGETNIDRWRHGWLLLKMVIFAMRKIKFI
jgi:ubiquinone/menaquinone biosynthesis C-methylase UbiE